MGPIISDKLWVAAAILAFGWLCPARAQTDATVPSRTGPNPPIEWCEAFPWDVRSEQSFNAASVSRLRRATQAMAPPGKPPARDRFAGRR